ncbi:MAG TPA: hypothetical protein PKH24_14035 [Sedimentisphaerales bacterium]|nr:hypothetical protein [Sedimentisphaerales bacterium]HNU28363.1 hypothetical protein [Sedimentisphaerales bacterium]
MMEAVMAWCVEANPQPGYLNIRLVSDVDARAFEETVAAILREIAAHNGSKVLIDIREAKARPGVLDTFGLISVWPAMHGLRVAILDRSENRRWFDFYETVSVNRGHNSRVFTDSEQAVQWLTG